MDIITEINLVSGIIFFIYILLSGHYWSSAERWADKLKKINEGENGNKQKKITKERKKIQKNRKNAEILFNICTGMGLFTIILITIPIYIENEYYSTICKWLLLIPLIVIVFLCFCWAFRFYFVDID